VCKGIICAADDTIEPPQVFKYKGKTARVINGFGRVHQCRDSDWIRDAVLRSEQTPFTAWDFENGDTLSKLVSNYDY
jgi:hypothetical protein